MNPSPVRAGASSQPCFWGVLGLMLDPKPEILGWISHGCLRNPTTRERNGLASNHFGKCWAQSGSAGEGSLGGKFNVQKVLGGRSCSWPCWEGMERGSEQDTVALGVSHTGVLGVCPSGAAVPVPGGHFWLPRVVFRRSHLCPPELLPQGGAPPAQQPPWTILGLPR